MWPFKKKLEHQIYFACDEWAIRQHAPIRPASEFLPPAFKDMALYYKKSAKPIDSDKTVKSCPGIIDYCSTGFVIPAWCDIEIEPGPNGRVVTRYSHPKYKEGAQPKDALQGFMGNKFKFGTPVKLDNPWTVWAAKGYSLFWQPMYYYDDSRNWEAIPGIIDHDKVPLIQPINIMLKQPKTTVIKMGEPLVQVIPLKREEITAFSGELTQSMIKRHNSLSYLKEMSFTSWVRHIREKKSYTVDVHDIELPIK
jgi:hypothetical protein